MIGFIKKDLLMIKDNGKMLVILLLLCFFFGMTKTMDPSFLISFLSVTTMLSIFNYDSFNHWDAYACTLLNGRRNMVISKYITSILLVVMTSFIVFLISYFFFHSFSLELFLLTFFVTLFILAMMYPFIFLFGTEKARIGIMIFVFGFIFLANFFLKDIDMENIFIFLSNYSFLFYLLMILLFLVSMFFSLFIVAKKEF